MNSGFASILPERGGPVQPSCSRAWDDSAGASRSRTARAGAAWLDPRPKLPDSWKGTRVSTV